MIYVWTPDWSNRYELSHAQSVQFSRHYNDYGSMTIVAPSTQYNSKVCKINGVVYDQDTDSAYVITRVQQNAKDNTLTVNGYSADWLLYNRVVANPFPITNIEIGALNVVSQNLRGLPRVQVGQPTGLTETTNAVFEKKGLLSEVTDVLALADLGRKMDFDPRALTFTFSVYKGRDKTTGKDAEVFSEERKTAKDLVITDDISGFKNVAYAFASYSSGVEFTTTVGTAEGAERREVWVDASSLTQVEEETDPDTGAVITAGESNASFLNRVQEYAKTELASYVRSRNFEVVVNPKDFGSVYMLGDMITCKSERFGVQFNARVTGVQYTLSDIGQETKLVLGDPEKILIGGKPIG